MSNLSNQQINSSFNGLLQIPGGITSSLQTVQDGNGNPTGLQLSSTGSSVTTSDTFVISENNIQFSTAVPRPIGDGFGDYISVKDFGAKGDGVTDDTTAFKNAVAHCAGNSIYIPFGTYVISDTINISNVHLFGDGISRLDSSANIILSGTFNKTAFYSNSRFTIEGFSITGNATTSTTLQNLIQIDNTNEGTVNNMFLNGGYNLIYITGTSFYTTIKGVRFYNCKNSWLNGYSTTSAGIDLNVSLCRGTSIDTDQKYGFYFDGLGSLIMTNCQFSPDVSQIATFYVNTMAALSGDNSISNVVFEPHTANAVGVYLKGTSGKPCNFFKFSNCSIAGEPAVTTEYSYYVSFSNVYFTGNQGFNAIHNSKANIFDSCHFETNGICVGADTAITKFSLAATDCTYYGGFPAIYLPNVSDSQVDYVTVRGGYLGTNANAVYLSDKNVKQDVSAINYLYGPISYYVFTGTLNSSGAAVITAGINGMNSNIVSVSAFWKGGSGEAYPLTVTVIDGTTISISTTNTSGVSKNYRCFVQYVQQNISW